MRTTLVVAAMVALCAVAGSAQNVPIPNSSFENGDLSGWTVMDPYYSVVSGDATDGTHAALGDKPTNGRLNMFYDVTDLLTPGVTYNFSMDFKVTRQPGYAAGSWGQLAFLVSQQGEDWTHWAPRVEIPWTALGWQHLSINGLTFTAADLDKSSYTHHVVVGVDEQWWGDTSTGAFLVDNLVISSPVADHPGDANRDGKVSVGDLGILAANYGFGTIPEPVTMSLLGLGGLALLRRRR